MAPPINSYNSGKITSAIIIIGPKSRPNQINKIIVTEIVGTVRKKVTIGDNSSRMILKYPENTPSIKLMIKTQLNVIIVLTNVAQIILTKEELKIIRHNSVKINKIELLPDVKDKLIEKITISTTLDALDETMLTEITSLINGHPGNAELHFHIKDIESQMQANLMSMTIKITVGKELIQYLKNNPTLEFSINS